MKYICFTFEGIISSVAQKLQAEGKDVVVAQIADFSLAQTSQEKADHKEDPEMKKRRLSLSDGLVKKHDAVKVLRAMKKIEDKGKYFVMGDYNSTFRFLELAQKMGYTGLIATEADRNLEVDREAGKQLVKEHYPDLKVAEYHEFKTIDEGIKFLEEHPEDMYVLKSLGDSGETVVPKGDDPEAQNKVIADTLKQDKKAYEENGFLLEQKIMDCVELTPQIVFWDGKLVFCDLDVETKTLFSGEVGPNKGCGTNLIVRTDPDDKINSIAFPPYVYELAATRKGLFIVDAGLLFERRTGRAYFTEFCFQRFGWDAFPTELAMAADADGSNVGSAYFEKVSHGQNPLRVRFGASARLFNLNEDGERYSEPGFSIQVADNAEACTFLYDFKQGEDGCPVSVGYQQDLAVVTGIGETLEEAINECYEYVDGVTFKDMGYRTRADFVSGAYPQAILPRLRYAVEQGLIKDSGILDDVAKLMH